MSILCEHLDEVIARFYLLLSPFGSFVMLCAAVALALVCSASGVRQKAPRLYYAIVGCVFLLCAYTLFNIYDLRRYRQEGLAISPLNKMSYFLFFAPPDLYEPYSIMPLSSTVHEYTANYKHRYGGQQEIVLNLINGTPKIFEYGNPDKINLAVKCSVSCGEMGLQFETNRTFTTRYLDAGTNHLILCKYAIETREALASTYNACVTIDDGLADFLKRYPGSYITIENGTTK